MNDSHSAVLFPDHATRKERRRAFRRTSRSTAERDATDPTALGSHGSAPPVNGAASLRASNGMGARRRGAMAACDARTQGARRSEDLGATEDAAARRAARPAG